MKKKYGNMDELSCVPLRVRGTFFEIFVVLLSMVDFGFHSQLVSVPLLIIIIASEEA